MTWAEFNDEVRKLMPQHNRRQGIQDVIDQTILNGCVDLQDAVLCFRENHVDEFEEADLDVDGLLHSGDLPDGPIKSAKLVWVNPDGPVTEYCTDLQLIVGPLTNELRCGKVPGGTGYLAVDVVAGKFYLSPVLDAESKLVLTWHGIKRTYTDGETVKYNITAAQAVAEYVLARLARQTDNDLNAAASHGGSYLELKRRLRRECRAKQFEPAPESANSL